MQWYEHWFKYSASLKKVFIWTKIVEVDLIFVDLYAFNIGCYVIWATIAAIGYAIDYLKTHNAKILLMQIVKWTGIITKSSMLLSLWV